MGAHEMNTIDSVEQLRALYPQPLERAVRKSLAVLDDHMRSFIALSPFVCMATSSDTGADVTPRGDAPGFVHVSSETTLLIPDWPGNNRLDSLSNLVLNHQVALLFFIPGVDETLRVNGIAEITIAPDILQRWDVNGKHPRSALSVTVREAYLHCAKALIRSKLWTDDYRVERTALPSYAQMLKDQTRLPDSVEQMQAAIQQSYTERLY